MAISFIPKSLDICMISLLTFTCSAHFKGCISKYKSSPNILLNVFICSSAISILPFLILWLTTDPIQAVVHIRPSLYFSNKL